MAGQDFGVLIDEYSALVAQNSFSEEDYLRHNEIRTLLAEEDIAFPIGIIKNRHFPERLEEMIRIAKNIPKCYPRALSDPTDIESDIVVKGQYSDDHYLVTQDEFLNEMGSYRSIPDVEWTRSVATRGDCTYLLTRDVQIYNLTKRRYEKHRTNHLRRMLDIGVSVANYELDRENGIYTRIYEETKFDPYPREILGLGEDLVAMTLSHHMVDVDVSRMSSLLTYDHDHGEHNSNMPETVKIPRLDDLEHFMRSMLPSYEGAVLNSEPTYVSILNRRGQS